MRTALRLLFFLFVAIGLTGCFRDQCEGETTYVRYEPVYRPIDEIRVAPVSEAPRDLRAPGKIYVFQQYLFIGELEKGIHIIDNSDPANPVPVAFWHIEGNTDIAVRDNYLYANQFMDLIVVDIQDIATPRLINRQENVFPEYSLDPEKGILTGYQKTNVVEKISCDDENYGRVFYWTGDVFFMDAVAATGLPGVVSVPQATGTAGSYARFGQYLDYLYTIDRSHLRSFSVADPASPQPLETVQVGWDIETLFPYGNKLFIGSESGMYVFDNSNPAKPVQEALFRHARACDPVVTDGNYAYVTLHSGNQCEGFTNQLDIIDIRDLPATHLINSIPMTQPKGLANTDQYVYVCDDGLRIMQKTGNGNLSHKKHIKGMATYDAIALSNEHLLVVGPDGFVQYNITDPVNPVMLSQIPVKK